MNKTAIMIRNQNIVEWKWVLIRLLRIQLQTIIIINTIDLATTCIPLEIPSSRNHPPPSAITSEDLKPA